jgi:tetratricopeptide (TPR) repeat protein
MRRALLLLVILVSGLLLVQRTRQPPPWTTDSAAARQALEAGLDAYMKIYTEDARAHFARAVALDPGFLVAKERLGRQSSGDELERLAAQLRQADLSVVTPRERFLVRYWLAQQVDRDREAAAAILDQRLREAPDDPFALYFAASIAFQERDRDRAEELFQRVIEIEPNWVLAQNLLGYLAMESGNFQQAEEHFKIYQYIAPDQANPHDSMGELLLILGRYDEAERELEMALSMRPSFTASYTNLMRIAVLERDATKAARILGRVETLPEQEDPESDQGEGWRRLSHELTCRRDIHLGFITGDWAETWGRAGPCMSAPLSAVLVHRAGLILGLDEDAAKIRATYARWLARQETPDGYRYPVLQAMQAHMEGDRQLAAAQGETAIEHFTRADALLTFGNDGQALFKLYNLGQLALAQEQASALAGGGEAIWRRIAAVNPRIRPFLEAGGQPLLERARVSPHSWEEMAAVD